MTRNLTIAHCLSLVQFKSSANMFTLRSYKAYKIRWNAKSHVKFSYYKVYFILTAYLDMLLRHFLVTAFSFLTAFIQTLLSFLYKWHN